LRKSVGYRTGLQLKKAEKKTKTAKVQRWPRRRLVSASDDAANISNLNRATQRWGKVYHLQYLPLPQGIWRRSVFFLHVVAADQAQWCTPAARMSRPVMRCAIADCGRQIMVSSATASGIAALHMRSSLMVTNSLEAWVALAALRDVLLRTDEKSPND
jgi:hypothetical protein